MVYPNQGNNSASGGHKRVTNSVKSYFFNEMYNNFLQSPSFFCFNKLDYVLIKIKYFLSFILHG